jgi:MoaA/NifB/PqqE/SkfB family radical SAM enzyme
MSQKLRLLQIEPTTRCNFTCGFCCGRHMPQEDVAYETFEAALDAFPDLEHVELQGEGEPLMHPRFFDMVELARKRNIKVSLITNGSLLIPSAVARILDAPLQKILISIESADPKTFQEIRGGRLERVIRNLEHLMEQRRARGTDRPVVGFAITVLTSTRDRIGDVFALYRRLGLDGGITLQPLQQLEVYTANYDAKMKAESLSVAQANDLWLRFFSDADVRRIHEQRSAIPGFFDELMDGWRPAQRTCPWLENGIYVSRLGQVTACCMVKDSERFGFGNLAERRVAAILERRREMQAQFLRGELPEACGGCSLGRFALMSKFNLLRFGARGIWNRWFASDTRPASDATSR